MDEKRDLLALTADIVAAFVARNTVPACELRSLITDVYRALSETASATGPEPRPDSAPRPAVPVRRSVHNEFIVCLEDGKRFKSLKRHLRTL